jgi:hypothetical protein
MHRARCPGKIKQSKSDEFYRDFDLYSAPHGNNETSTAVPLQLPDIFQINDFESTSTSSLSTVTTSTILSRNVKKSSTIDSDSISSQFLCKSRENITKKLITIYKNKRLQVFYNMARTRATARSKEFFRIYLNPSESLMKNKSHHKYHRTKYHKKKEKPFSYEMEYERLRGLRESEEELAKVQAYIDKMIAKNIKKFEEEKRKRQMAEKQQPAAECHYPTLQELVCAPNNILFKDFLLKILF